MCGLTNSPRTCFRRQFTAKSAKDVKQVRVATHDGLLAMSTSAGSTLPAQNCVRWEAEVKCGSINTCRGPDDPG